MKQINKKKTFFSLMLIILAVAFIGSACVKAVPPKLNLLPSDFDTGISWNQAVKLKKPIIANFYVDYCGYCKRFAPILESMRAQYKSRFTFVIINCEERKNKSVVRDFGITSYPSLYLVNPKNDNRVYINPSFYTDKTRLKKEFDRFLKNNK